MAIVFDKVNHIYQKDTPYEYHALKDVNLNLEDHRFYAIVGHTGSGKSTLIQHVNALIKPTDGFVKVGKFAITNEKKKQNLKELRSHAGLVFQFPEHQLFEETIEKDIIFGPMNFGVDEIEAKKRASEVIELVGLDRSYLSRSPFELSGGQMRRIAIAGVLAMYPDVLILDEPTSGLDPQGQKEMLDLFKNLNKEHNKTIILVTHHMNDVCEFADEVIIMNKAKVFMQGSISEVFNEEEKIQDVGLDAPSATSITRKLNKLGIPVKEAYTFEQLINNLEEVIK
jgi:energy-coupling factor transport system ATP-binding protein